MLLRSCKEDKASSNHLQTGCIDCLSFSTHYAMTLDILQLSASAARWLEVVRGKAAHTVNTVNGEGKVDFILSCVRINCLLPAISVASQPLKPTRTSNPTPQASATHQLTHSPAQASSVHKSLGIQRLNLRDTSPFFGSARPYVGMPCTPYFHIIITIITLLIPHPAWPLLEAQPHEPQLGPIYFSSLSTDPYLFPSKPDPPAYSQSTYLPNTFPL